jgi:hypothetical protein
MAADAPAPSTIVVLSLSNEDGFVPHDALRFEVLALRHPLPVLQRTPPERLRLAKSDR